MANKLVPYAEVAAWCNFYGRFMLAVLRMQREQKSLDSTINR